MVKQSWINEKMNALDPEKNQMYTELHYKNLIKATIPHKNIETNEKFYRKVAFLMYTEMVNFRP